MISLKEAENIPSFLYENEKSPAILINISDKSINFKENKPFDINFVCTCEKSNSIIQKRTAKKENQRDDGNYGINSDDKVCNYCFERHYDEYLLKNRKEKLIIYPYSYRKPIVSEKIKTTIFIEKHPNDESGILIKLIDSHREAGVETENGQDKYKCIQNNVVKICSEIIPGVVAKTYRVNKTKLTEVDPFDGLNINKDTVSSSSRKIIFEDSVNVIDFLMKNQEFGKKMGIIDALKYSEQIYPLENFFINYLCLIMAYPVIELLIKMGYIKMFNDVMDSLFKSESKKEISEKVKNLNKLLNDTTKGSMALRIPSYIGKYLKENSSPLTEFLAWSDLYEFENFSKEQFEKLTNSLYFIYIKNTYQMNKISNILKYGYKTEQLFKYIYKQDILLNNNQNRNQKSLYLINDYLEMCEMLEISPDLFPKNIKDVHDRCSILIRSKELSMYDEKIKKIGEAVSFAINSYIDEEKLTKMQEEYTVILPMSSKDFVEEGQNQHNCVASYSKKVYDEKCIIFFVRKKSDPTQSYITAEYSNGELNQCMHKNNKRVEDADMLNFCKVICNRIKYGYVYKNKRERVVGFLK